MKGPHKLLYGDSIPYSPSSGKLVPPFQKWWDFSPRVVIVHEPGEVDGEAVYPAQVLCTPLKRCADSGHHFLSTLNPLPWCFKITHNIQVFQI